MTCSVFTAAAGGRVAASPYAKKLAAEAGVSLADAQGTGPSGRIVAADVQQLISSGGGKKPAAAQPTRPAAAGAAAPTGAPGAGEYTDVAVSQIKKITAQRLLESKLTIPHYYLTMECEVGGYVLDCIVLPRQFSDMSAAHFSLNTQPIAI